MKDILERAYAGEPISTDDPEFETLTTALEEALSLIHI